jgi:hypothetical protein
MTVLNYDKRSATSRPLHRPNFGIGHNAPQWKAAAAALKLALYSAVACAQPTRRSCTPDTVGDAVIDVISRLDTRQLRTLALIVAMLDRNSRGNG